MKYLATTIFIVFLSNITVFAQLNLLEVVNYNEAFMSCTQEYSTLTRHLKSVHTVADTFLLDGKLYTGNARQDYPANKQYYIYTFKNGLVEKQETYYYNGQKAADFTFKNGVSDGIHIMYYDNGDKYIEEHYKNGKKEGYHRMWYNNGQLGRELSYENGELKSSQFFDKSGKETDEGC